MILLPKLKNMDTNKIWNATGHSTVTFHRGAYIHACVGVQ